MPDTFNKLLVINTTPGAFICPGVEYPVGQRLKPVTWSPGQVISLAEFHITRAYLDKCQTFQTALRMGLKYVPDDYSPAEPKKYEKPTFTKTSMGTVKAKDDPDTVAVEDLDDSQTGADQEPEPAVLLKRAGQDVDALSGAQVVGVPDSSTTKQALAVAVVDRISVGIPAE